MGKVWWKSRAIWIHALMCLAPFAFGREWIHQPISLKIMQLHAALGFLLRIDTKGPVTLKSYQPREESGL